MRIRISALFLPALAIALLFSCVSQNHLIRYSPAEGSGKWIDGREYSETVKNKIKVGITFDKIDQDNLVFNLSVTNGSKSDFLFDPAEIFYVLHRDSTPGKKNKHTDTVVRAIDPEDMIYRVKMSIANENDLYRADQLMNIAGGCAGTGSMMIAKDSKSFDEAAESSDDAHDEYDRRELQHESRIKKYNDDIKFLEEKAFRKNTILPGKSKEGRLFFPVKKGAGDIVINIPAGDGYIEFTFIKSVIEISNTGKRPADIY